MIVAVLAMASFAIVALAPTAQAAYSFSANLKQGSTGADVMELQKMLNTNAATQVSTSGAGSREVKLPTLARKPKRQLSNTRNSTHQKFLLQMVLPKEQDLWVQALALN